MAAEPTLGRAGYWMMSVTALFATAGATNAGLYPATGLCNQMASIGQFPPVMGRQVGGRAGTGLVVTAAIAIVLAVGFDLSAIASIGSVIALLVFGLVSVGHLRVRHETGARAWILVLAVAVDRHRPRVVRVHHAGRGAGHGRGARRHPAGERCPRLRVEAVAVSGARRLSGTGQDVGKELDRATDRTAVTAEPGIRAMVEPS